MIDSIIELPEYITAQNFADIDGQRYNGLYSGLGFEMHGELDQLVDGRRIIVPRGWHKYKLKLTDFQANRVYNIIGVTPRPVDLTVPHPDRNLEIDFYPLYVREYTRSGKVHASAQSSGNVFLWLPGINRFLAQIMLPDTVSLAQAFRHIISLGVVQDFDHIPYEIKDDHLDLRFATLAPIPDNTMFNMVDSESYTSHDLLMQAVSQCCVPEGYFSDRLMYCLGVQRFGQLNCLIDPLHQSDPISICARASKTDNWDICYDWIHLTDDDAPRYLTNDRSEAIAQLLYCASLIPTPDFHIECTSATFPLEPAQGFNPFMLQLNKDVDPRKFVQRVSENVHTLYCSDYFKDTRRFRLQGTYLEELCILDASRELVGYIDQVWWILATGYGLLNYKCVYT